MRVCTASSVRTTGLKGESEVRQQFQGDNRSKALCGDWCISQKSFK